VFVLQSLVPVTEEMAVPKEYHGHIIGQKGHDVRRLMEEYDVNIVVPPSTENTDVLRISGTPANIEHAKHALGERIRQLDEEKQERVC
jgi:polyribonucleotide nucleotidyltransferase